VSTRDQNPEAQEAELRAAGCSRVFMDHGVSSRIAERPEWVKCLEYLRDGDTLVFRALDRIAGSEMSAIQTLHDLGERGVTVHSLTEPALNVDPSTPMGRAMLSFMATIAQLRVDTIRANTLRGLAHARAQGRVGGRTSVMTPERVEMARQMRESTDPPMSYDRIAQALGVGRSSVIRALSKDAQRQ
jgi:DNA invertase Pin-like site-specific DNA recombinase